MKIGFDILGGDHAPQNCLEGLLLAYHELPKDVRIVIIGDSNIAKAFLEKIGVNTADFDFVHTEEVIHMAEHPTKAFSQKPNSSISLGYKLLKEKQIDVFASGGNTGAMLVGAMFTVKTIPGVIRPCVTSLLPKEDGGYGVLLDIGINADCKPDVLYQFGILGSICAREVYKIENPRVALLNIGEEQEKGNLIVQAAHGLMRDSKDFNFIGNVEGKELFTDKADVIVCEGFIGNVLVKNAEAFYDLIVSRGRADEYFEKFNYELHGGAPILGVNGNVVVGHGKSTGLAFKNMILLAQDVANAKLNDKITQILQ